MTISKCKKGFNLDRKRNKCVKKKKPGRMKHSGSFKRKNKSYNPFKMWGSYVGALIGLFFGVSIYSSSRPEGFVPNIMDFFINSILYRPTVFLIPLGFLIGWGIHSLIRKIRN